MACPWNELGQRLPAEVCAPDVVLGSCLLYEKDAALALAGALSQVLKSPSAQVAYIVAAEWEGCQDAFVARCREAQLAVERSELQTWAPDAEQEATTKHALFTIRAETLQ